MNAPAVSVPGTEVRRDPNVYVSIVACAAAAAQLFVIPSLSDALRRTGARARRVRRR